MGVVLCDSIAHHPVINGDVTEEEFNCSCGQEESFSNR